MPNHSDISHLIGRLLMPRLEIRPFEEDVDYRERILSLVRLGHANGFCVFKGSVSAAKATIAELQKESLRETGRELLFSCDAEWGVPMRLNGNATEFPHALALAHAKRPNSIYDAALATAHEMRALGIHWSFAPVADVNSDPENPIINIRAFGEDAETVSIAASRYAAGLRDGGVLACAKHFPGHGQTHVDSHRSLPVLDIDPAHFEQIEFEPFRALIALGIPSVMTGHLAAPRLARSLGADETAASMPASVSPFLTRMLLRERFAFDGVIVTDSMEMGGLKGIFENDALAAEAALRAGNDIVLMTPNVEAVHAHLCDVYSRDEAFAADIHDSVKRIDAMLVRPESRVSAVVVNHEEGVRLADAIAASAIETTGDTTRLETIRTYCVVADDPLLQADHVQVLEREIERQLPHLRHTLMADITAAGAGELAVFILERPRGRLLDEGSQSVARTPVQEFTRRSKTSGISPRCIFFLGNPYLGQAYIPQRGECRVFSYSDSAPSARAVVGWLQSQL